LEYTFYVLHTFFKEDAKIIRIEMTK